MIVTATDPVDGYEERNAAEMKALGPKAEERTSLLDPAARAKVELFAEEIRRICAAATNTPLQDSREAAGMSELLGRGAVAEKELTRCRRAAVDPLNEQVKKINGVFKPLTDALAAFETRAKRLLGAWNEQEAARVRREQEAARQAAEAAARAEQEALAKAEKAKTDKARQKALADAEAASRAQTAAMVMAPHDAPRGIKTDAGTTFTRKRWVFEVVNAEAVPRSFCSPDDKLIRAAVSGGCRMIPGVNITETEEIAVRV